MSENEVERDRDSEIHSQTDRERQNDGASYQTTERETTEYNPIYEHANLY